MILVSLRELLNSSPTLRLSRAVELHRSFIFTTLKAEMAPEVEAGPQIACCQQADGLSDLSQGQDTHLTVSQAIMYKWCLVTAI